MNIQILGSNDPLWSNSIHALRYDIYHVPEYLTIEAKRTLCNSHALLIEKGDKIMFVPFLIHSNQERGDSPHSVTDVTSPYGYPGILFSQRAMQSPEFVKNAFHSLYQTMKDMGACTAFLRLHPILNHCPSIINIPGLTISSSQTVSVNLTLTESQIWACTRKGHKSTVNKAQRLGYSARMVDLRNNLAKFFSIYKQTMNRVNCSDRYHFGETYFSDLAKLEDRIFLCVVEKSGEIAAACIFFECNGIVQAHLGGTQSSFLKDSPFTYLLHFACLWAKERDNEYLHLGGGVGGKLDQVYCYKTGFSKHRHNFRTLKIVLDNDKYTELVRARATSLGLPSRVLLKSAPFPAYRSPI